MQKQHRTIAITAALTAAVLFGAFGIKQAFAHEGFYGTCNAFTDRCHDVPAASLELVAGYHWDASSARVLESSATLPHGLLGSAETVTGVIEFHNVGQGISLGDGTSYPAQAGTAVSTEKGESVLRRLGVTEVKTLRNRDQLVVLRGETDDATLVYVSSLLGR